MSIFVRAIVSPRRTSRPAVRRRLQRADNIPILVLAEGAECFRLDTAFRGNRQRGARDRRVIWRFRDDHHVITAGDHVEVLHRYAKRLERLTGRVESLWAVFQVVQSVASPAEESNICGHREERPARTLYGSPATSRHGRVSAFSSAAKCRI